MRQADPVAFVRAFPQSPGTVCTEPVLAWLSAKGLAHPFDARLQRRLWARAGWRGVFEVLKRMHWHLERPEGVAYGLCAGDVVIARQAGGAAICGVAGADGLVALAASGRVRIARLQVLRVARPRGH